jgi:hypothetical protein
MEYKSVTQKVLLIIESKYAHCFLLNSRHFEVGRHTFSQTSVGRVQRCQIQLFELHFHIPYAVLFHFRFENYRARKPRQ